MKRTNFNLSHEVKLTCKFGTLIPILCQEILPHDTIKCSTELFSRFQALLAPVMQQVEARIEYFFVPNRILWYDWKDFITDSAQTSLPSISLTSAYYKKHTLADYLGIPTTIVDPDDPEGVINPSASATAITNALPFKAYQRIWYDWYADQNMQASAINDLSDNSSEFNLVGGSLNPAYYAVLRQRCYPRDYFTSALPWAQKGQPVRLPLSYDSNGNITIKTPANTSNYPEVGFASNSLAAKNSGGTTGSYQWKLGGLSNAVQGPTIEEVRRANALQKWLERNARYGTRYVEQIAAHFGIRVPDYRLSRSEFLGRSINRVVVSEVLQQSQTTDTGALGDQGGHAAVGGVGGMRKYTASEHGWFFAILSFVPRTSYGEGVPRYFQKTNYLDFGFPEFDNLGEQPINQLEVDGYGVSQGVTFGYQPRYAEYKQSYNRFCGDFRDTLAFWHLGRCFSHNFQPALNESFVTIDGGQDGEWTDRIFAVQDGESSHILCQCYHHLLIKRRLGRNIPSL